MSTVWELPSPANPERVPNNGPVDFTNLLAQTYTWSGDAQYMTINLPQDTPTSPAYIVVCRNGRVFFFLEDDDNEGTEMVIPEF